MQALTKQEVFSQIALLPPAEQEVAIDLALELYDTPRGEAGHDFDSTRLDPHAYIQNILGYTPWRGQAGATGQAEIIDHYALVLKQLHERRDYEQGEKSAGELEHWRPGQEIQNWISVDAGHNLGKTTVGAFIVNHFFDHFPAIGYCFAPTFEQINDLLFKEIRVQRRGKGLPGEVLEGEPRIKHTEDHFVKGKATNNSHNTGTERAQGQHNEYLIFVIDEAEAVPKFVYDAVRSMASGGICVVVILRNPRTTTCEANKVRKESNCKAFRISCVDHPNVREGREVIPGSVRRDYVEEMLKGCELVAGHSPDDYTFELPWRPGEIYRPSTEFLWRVQGIVSLKGADDTFCPPGRYEAATEREPYDGDDPEMAWVGVDCARYGNDLGKVYVRHVGRVWKDREFAQQDGYVYYVGIKETCRQLKERGVKRVSVRMDAGGGYHSTACDNLRRDADIQEWFQSFAVVEVHNNGTPKDADKYADLVTEMYFYAAEALKVLRLDSPSPPLEEDLCSRRFKYVIKTAGEKTRLDLKQLVSKEKFREKFGRSPDDGDGFVLAVAPDHLFTPQDQEFAVMYTGKAKIRLG
jgi:hypothetical protein